MTLKSGICTLFEGDYHFGLAAFINSLHRAGYAGPVWAGYRGVLPPWLHQLEKTADPHAYVVGGTIRLVFVPIETKIHFANYKPAFMLDLLGGKAGDCEYLWYFDPDIFLRCEWAFFENWQNYGIAVCEEIVSYNMAENDPLRLRWVDVGREMGLKQPRCLNRYFNSGMVGAAQSHRDFLEIWKDILDYVGTIGVDLKAFQSESRALTFGSGDQDALNMALMYTMHPLSTMGPQAMGFTPGGFTMYHTTGPKPWRAKFLRRALSGVPPSSADKFFFTQVTSPISVYSSLQLRVRWFCCSAAALIGRFYRRT